MNVRSLRPMRLLLVGDVGDGYAEELAAAADPIQIDVTTVAADDDVHVAARRAHADAVVFDAGAEPRSVAVAASAFAGRHPRTIVAMVATGVDDRNDGAVLVSHRWRAPELLLDRLTQMYLAASRSRLVADEAFSRMNVR